MQWPKALSLHTYRSYFSRLTWIRRRFLAVFAVLGAAWLATIAIFYIEWQFFGAVNLGETLRGVFVAWAGELIFFTVVGITIAVITLRDPRAEHFEERFRMLYGQKQIPDTVAN